MGVSTVVMQIGTWKGSYSLMAGPLDDFAVILQWVPCCSQDWVIAHHGGLMIYDESCPSSVSGIYYDELMAMKMQSGLISAMQLNTGVRHGEVTYSAWSNLTCLMRYWMSCQTCWWSLRMWCCLSCRRNCLRERPRTTKLSCFQICKCLLGPVSDPSLRTRELQKQLDGLLKVRLV